ncbi:PilZ domain-containing protein [Krasilnikovia sp. MM14-A1259]|uniref:PilZ domain-containing protein n=1 Tax=Krasilnikovia sp. MM14-A1259 TaxID=3373539 RepID=UPI00381DA841
MVTVPAGSTLVLRCPGEQPVTLITLAEVSAAFVAELPPIPVLSPDGTRRFGILELVSSAGVTWVEAELRDGLLTRTGDPPTDVVQRRGAPRRPGAYAATGTVELDTEPGRRLVAVSGQVEDVSTSGLLLRATPADSVHLPPGIVRTLLHVSMPWGDMTATVATVDQRADQLRGTYEWMDPADEEALRAFCAAR